ncbi:MAG: RNA-processing protein [Methanocorpusculum sp.]|nr:RNA-processing protein [Methanocorpusculum sp.]
MNWYGNKGSYSTAPEICAKNIASPDTGRLCRTEDLIAAGLVKDRAEYLAAVRNTAFYLAEKGIAEALSEKDTGLLQMVRMLDELDRVINLLTERILEWHQGETPSASRKYTRAGADKMLQKLAKNASNPAMKPVAREILSLNALRAKLTKEVSAEADKVLPNMSALVGGLVAARLVSRAGGLKDISRMASSSIQVLGAESALFSHIRTGTPSPKHGLIFQHRRVHNAPREIRGRVARVLAAKLAAASRLDYFREEMVPEFIESANKKIDDLMNGGGEVKHD